MRYYSFGSLHLELKPFAFHALKNKPDVGYLVNSLLRKSDQTS